MLRIAICDDNKSHRKEIRTVVSNLMFEQSDLSIELFSDGEVILRLIDNGLFDFDLLFLDIEMPLVNGIKTAKAIRENKLNTEIIFITAHEEYVYDGYSYRAFAFLRKPVSTSRLSKEISRYLLERENDTSNYLAFSIGGCHQRIHIGRIDYIESSKRKATIKMGRESMEFYSKLDDIEEQIGGRIMVRTHQSYLVNISKVTRVTRTNVELEGGGTIPVSKRYYENASEAFASYYGCRVVESKSTN